MGKPALAAVLFALAACHRAPDEPKTIGPGIEQGAIAACANLRRIGCPEGQGSVGGITCAEIIVRANSLRSMPVQCWAEAENVVAAKSCGSLRCVR